MPQAVTAKSKEPCVAEPLLVSVIDDDEDVRFALGALFRSSGYEVECFESGETFFADDAHRLSACVVSDIQMPGMSGLDLSRELRARQIATPIILISAFATDAIRRMANKIGVYCLMEKPFEPDMLMERVQAATGEDAPSA